MKKKFLGSLLAIVMGLCVFAGCGGGQGNGGEGGDGKEEEKGIVWVGCDDVSLARGDRFDLTEGIQVRYDGVDITDTLEVSFDDNFDSEYTGRYTVEYEAMNKDGDYFTKERRISVAVAHNVGGGKFDNRATYKSWQFDTPSGKGAYSVKNEEATFSIQNSGNQWWSLQFYQKNLYLTKGVTYRFTFDAKSATGHSVSAGFEEVNNNNRMMQTGTKAIRLTEEWQKYSMTYTSDADVMDAKAVIYLGWQLPGDEGEHDIAIDNVYIEKIEKNENAPVFQGIDDVRLISGGHSFDPNSGVACTDKNGTALTYTVTGIIPAYSQKECTYLLEYSATDAMGNSVSVLRNVKMTFERENEYELINPDFSAGLTGWNLEVMQTEGNGEVDYTGNTETGELTVSVLNPSDQEHHIQLYQQDVVKFKAGETYRLSVRVKASAARKIRIDVLDVNTQDYIGNATKYVTLGTEYQTFTIEFTADKDYENVKVAVMLGKIENTAKNIDVTFDSIVIEKIVAEG